MLRSAASRVGFVVPDRFTHQGDTLCRSVTQSGRYRLIPADGTANRYVTYRQALIMWRQARRREQSPR